MNVDERYMDRALELATRGIGTTYPNPNVGAVLVSDGAIAGEGYHRGPGKPHAEIEAISQAAEKAKGGTLYVNLEPCCHYGETPPCTEAIIKAGLERVVFSILDPDSRVCGQGCSALAASGIEVSTGVRAREAFDINLPFLHVKETGMPLVTVKMALTLDGSASVEGGGWFTSGESRRRVHFLRAVNEAVAVGIGTVKKDDPRLDRRFFEHPLPPPVRMVFDPELEFPKGSRWLSEGGRVILYCGEGVDGKKIESILEAGAEVVQLPRGQRGLDLVAWKDDVRKKNIPGVLVEGGASMATSFVREGLFDRMVLFVAPRLSGTGGIPWFGDLEEPDYVKRGGLKTGRIVRSGEDIMVVYDSAEVRSYFDKLKEGQ